MIAVYRSYRYQLLPTRAQNVALTTWLRLGCELYNAALQERRDAWKKQRARVTVYDQSHDLAEVRAHRPEFSEIPIVVLRGWLRRLDRAFQAFFRRCKRGDAPGYPRFRAARRFDTIEVDDVGKRSPIVAGGNRIAIPLLGKVKFRQHRPLEGTPKSYRVTRDGDRWRVTIQCADVPVKPLPATDAVVGIDVGLYTLVATSDGELFKNPRTLQNAEREIARAQRRVSRRKKGSARRRKAVAILAKKHQRVANIRREHAILIARSLVARYGIICFEDLNIKGLARGMLAKSVHDAAWGILLHWIRVKAEEAARETRAADPRGTSINCNECGAPVPKALATRVHRCSCGCVVDRDVNAARNVRNRAVGAVGERHGLTRPQRPEQDPFESASAAQIDPLPEQLVDGRCPRAEVRARIARLSEGAVPAAWVSAETGRRETARAAWLRAHDGGGDGGTTATGDLAG